MGLAKRVGEISILGGDFEIDMILFILLCLEPLNLNYTVHGKVLTVVSLMLF